MSASGWVHLDVERVERETDAAFLLRIVDRDEPVWVPKSQVSEPDVYAAGDEGVTVSISEWCAKQKGLEG